MPLIHLPSLKPQYNYCGGCNSSFGPGEFHECRGHAPTPPPPPPSRAALITEAIEAERDACAEMFERLPFGLSLNPAEVADMIRNRKRPR